MRPTFAPSIVPLALFCLLLLAAAAAHFQNGFSWQTVLKKGEPRTRKAVAA